MSASRQADRQEVSTTSTLDRLTTALESHHEHLRDRLVRRSQAVIRAVATGRCYEAERRELVEFLHAELLAHTEVEEGLLYSSGECDATALLLAALQDEHRTLAALAAEIERATDGMDVVVVVGALVAVFAVCIQHENRYLLPALAAARVELLTLVQVAPDLVGAVATPGRR